MSWPTVENVQDEAFNAASRPETVTLTVPEIVVPGLGVCVSVTEPQLSLDVTKLL